MGEENKITNLFYAEVKDGAYGEYKELGEIGELKISKETAEKVKEQCQDFWDNKTEGVIEFKATLDKHFEKLFKRSQIRFKEILHIARFTLHKRPRVRKKNKNRLARYMKKHGLRSGFDLAE